MTSLDLISQYYDDFNRGDFAAMTAKVAENFQHYPNQGVLRTGKATFAEFLQRMDHCYHERVTELVVMATADGTRASAEFVIVGEYLEAEAGLPPARGQLYRLPVGAFFAIERGVITRLRNYYNLEDWLKQVT